MLQTYNLQDIVVTTE